jgi:hypothetical protein
MNPLWLSMSLYHAYSDYVYSRIIDVERYDNEYVILHVQI